MVTKFTPMDEMKPLDVLFPGPRRPIFAAMYVAPSRWWSLPELAGRAGVNPATLRQHLGRLRDAGLIREKSEGGRPWFQPDPECPIFDEMQAIVTKLTARTRGKETILIVEDQEATAQITRILLESWGYHVIEAHSGGEALQVFSRDGDGVQLVLADVIMPEMTGPQLARELWKLRPGLRVVFMSGYPSEQLNDTDAAFLPKPFNPASLSRMIRKELDRHVNGRRQMKGS
jgi:CheY-like chemotaxis protein